MGIFLVWSGHKFKKWGVGLVVGSREALSRKLPTKVQQILIPVKLARSLTFSLSFFVVKAAIQSDIQSFLSIQIRR